MGGRGSKKGGVVNRGVHTHRGVVVSFNSVQNLHTVKFVEGGSTRIVLVEGKYR